MGTHAKRTSRASASASGSGSGIGIHRTASTTRRRGERKAQAQTQTQVAPLRRNRSRLHAVSDNPDLNSSVDEVEEQGAWRDSMVSLDEIQSWRESGPSTPLLDTVNYPVHIKNFNSKQLKTLSKEVRAEVINSVSNSGGRGRFVQHTGQNSG